MKLQGIIIIVLLIGLLQIEANPQESESGGRRKHYPSFSHGGYGNSYENDVDSSKNPDSNPFWTPSYLFYHDMLKNFLVSKFGTTTEAPVNKIEELIPPIRIPAGQPLLDCFDISRRSPFALDGYLYECDKENIVSDSSNKCLNDQNFICYRNENSSPQYSVYALSFIKDIQCNGTLFDNARGSISYLCFLIVDDVPIPGFFPNLTHLPINLEKDSEGNYDTSEKINSNEVQTEIVYVTKFNETIIVETTEIQRENLSTMKFDGSMKMQIEYSSTSDTQIEDLTTAKNNETSEIEFSNTTETLRRDSSTAKIDESTELKIEFSNTSEAQEKDLSTEKIDEHTYVQIEFSSTTETQKIYLSEKIDESFEIQVEYSSTTDTQGFELSTEKFDDTVEAPRNNLEIIENPLPTDSIDLTYLEQTHNILDEIKLDVINQDMDPVNIIYYQIIEDSSIVVDESDRGKDIKKMYNIFESHV